MNAQRIIDSEKALKGLKTFQKRTVEHAYRELYREGGSGRFLVADEVGLGKTFVARGVIAKMLDLQGANIKRIDVIYVCSNSAIARQNLDKLIPRLDIPKNQIGTPGQATRLTLLPKIIHDLASKRVNFISFTPGTTFEHKKSRQGRADERAVIYKILEPLFEERKAKFKKVMEGDGEKAFCWELNNLAELDAGLSEKYQRKIRGATRLFERLDALVCSYDRRRRNEFKDELNDVIAELRELLAQVCLDALEPDLVILDEFQRFKNLLKMDDDEESLPSRLFRYSDEEANADTKVLLLSATPYKMYTCESDVDETENHYDDYLDTLRFLFRSNEDRVSEVEHSTKAFRDCLSGDGDQWIEAKANLEKLLKRVMCRTERVALTHEFDAMIKEVCVKLPLQASDLKEAPKLDALARYLDADNVITYWGSVPYALNFLRDYDLGDKLEKALGAPGKKSSELSRLIGQIKQFRGGMYNNCQTEIKPANHSMRYLFERALGKDKQLWKLLWLPPSMPYTRPSGVYEGVGPVTKTLVFSAWNAVPDAIATLVSAEAERRMYGRDLNSRRSAKNKFKPRLVFRSQEDGVAGVTTLLIMLPFSSLLEYDPMSRAIDAGGSIDALEFKREVSGKIAKRLEGLSVTGKMSGVVDSDWYWAAPILMDKDATFRDWLIGLKDDDNWEESKGRSECLEHVKHVLKHPEGLGRRPDDLADVLAEVAIGGPAVCAARSFMRVLGLSTAPTLFDCAYAAGDGFRSLFNKYAVVALVDREVKSRRIGFWRKVLRYCIDGNVQALLDEQVHMLKGFGGVGDDEEVESVASDLFKALSIRASPVSVQEFPKDTKVGEPFRVACRYAMRFGGTKKSVESDKEVVRSEDVRLAFDSPFRPFVLATTSIGQEGLDFHQWCHAVMHWNLPSNPVDLEQREGRVHRYKGHAVRKNVAAHYGLSSLREMHKGADPWEYMFDLAKGDQGSTKSELVPCWIYEDGDAKIERLAPYVPLSRAEARLSALKRGLGRYRLAFGQPRQEELVALYSDRNVEDIRQRTLSLLPDADVGSS